MRLFTSLLLAAAVLLSSCAYQGTIVEKDARPHPLYHSVGIEGTYTFFLRDNAGIVHRQMVTADVFERYDVGEYFSDLQPAPASGNPSEAKATVAVAMHRPTFDLRRTANRTKAKKTPALAVHRQKKRTAKSTRTVAARKAASTRHVAQKRKVKAKQAQRSAKRSTPRKTVRSQAAKVRRPVAKRTPGKPKRVAAAATTLASARSLR